ncbi:MAG: M61 family metallopeptidase [Thermoplasmata archaeon]
MTDEVALTYTLASFDPNAHRGRWTLEIRGVREPTIDLVMPVWAPGAYEIRESAREVRELSASRPRTAGELAVERVEKNRWRIRTEGSPSVEVRYTVYGHEASDDGFDVTDEHVFVNATRALPFVAGREGEPVEIVLPLPEGWGAHAELTRLAERPARFRARNYEELVDSPIDCGRPVELSVRPGGVPHRILLCGGPGNYEIHRLEEDVRQLVEAHQRYFGGSPVPSYTFFVHLNDRRGGGLEHLRSTSLVVERNSFRPPEDYEKFLSLVSHEYFHLYNVKRIRPAALGPFDFTRENYTHQLWWMEGTTDYVALLLLRRSGLLAPARYLQKLAELGQRLLTVPGRAVRSLEEASFTAWVDLYRPYEESRNQSVSYYLKGHLVSACLDLEIRHLSENRRSLDNVFAALWAEFERTGRGLGEGELREVIDRAAESDLGGFYSDYVSGTRELDLDRFVRYAGLRFAPVPRPKTGPEAWVPGHFGIEFTNDAGRVRIREVHDGGPGRRAGLAPGDEIVALDGARVLHDGFADALKRFPPGSSVTVDLFRRGLLRRVELTTGTPPPAKYALNAVADATPLEKEIYAGWIGAPWEPAKTPADPPP